MQPLPIRLRLFVFLFLYESSNLSLEAVDQMYNDPKCKPWNSGNWAPQGYTDRKDLIEKTRAQMAHRYSADGGSTTTGSATYNSHSMPVGNEKV